MERLRHRRRQRTGGSEPGEGRRKELGGGVRLGLRKQDVTRGNEGLEDIRKKTISRVG